MLFLNNWLPRPSYLNIVILKPETYEIQTIASPVFKCSYHLITGLDGIQNVWYSGHDLRTRQKVVMSRKFNFSSVQKVKTLFMSFVGPRFWSPLNIIMSPNMCNQFSTARANKQTRQVQKTETGRPN